MSGSREWEGRDSKERPRSQLTSSQGAQPNYNGDISQRKDSIARNQNGHSKPEQRPAVPPKPRGTHEDFWNRTGATRSESPTAAELRAAEAAIQEFRLNGADFHEPQATDTRTRDVEMTDAPRNDPSRKSTLEPERKGSVYDDKPAPQSTMLQATQSECEILRARVFELQENLKDAHDVIFSLQPRQQRFTETEAAAEFNTLCGSVEMLVDRKVGAALDEKALPKEGQCRSDPAKMLINLIPTPGREAFKYPETDEYNVTAAILHFLLENIFDLEFYCPLGEQEREFMNSVEKSMRNLEPRRDVRTIRTWRCETYTAIANRPEFQQRCERRKRDLTDRLTDLLHLLAPGSNTRSLESSVRKDITEPAFALAHKMHLSVDRFAIEWSPLHNLRSDQRGKFTAGFSDYELVDLKTNSKPKDPSAALDYVFDITPRLVFSRIKADTYDQPKVLKKPKVLVLVTKDGRREPDRYQAVDATVLGWLNYHLNEPRRGTLIQRTVGGLGQFAHRYA